ncbi:MAG: UDP-N-acetylmuramate dehydrogenase [Patescibacteria group bacterium]
MTKDMKLYKNFSLSKILYYRIGGNAQYLLKIENKTDLLEALDFVKKNQIKKVLPVGLGSNLLMSDNFFDGAVLWFSTSSKNEITQKDSGLIEAFSSVLLDDLIQFCFSKNLIGLEWAGGLPSTIGGAVRGNVGAFGGEIGKSVDKIEVFEIGANGEFVQKALKGSQLQFDYRDSLIKEHKNWIIGNSSFKLNNANKRTLGQAKETYLSYIEYRNKNHPMDSPSCGSVFKNITKKEEVEKIIDKWPDIKDLVVNKWYNKTSTGYVINRLGFSGYRIRGAEVSKKHANYIVNVGDAKFNDVYSIIQKVKEKFYKTFGFNPELEMEVVE